MGVIDIRSGLTDLIDEDYESSILKINDGGGGSKSTEQISLNSFFSARRTLDSKNKDEIRKLEKEKKEQIEVVVLFFLRPPNFLLHSKVFNLF